MKPEHRQRLLFIAASFAAAAFNYFLYPLLARILSPSDFGDISAILAIATQVGGIFIAFNIISIYFVERYGEDARHKISLVQGQILRVFTVLTLAAIVAYPLVRHFLNLSNVLYIFPLIVILVTAIPVAMWSGFFQGKGEFARVGVFNVTSSLAKLLLGAIGAKYGQALGALIGVTIGQLIGIAVTILYPGSKPPRLQFKSTRSLESGEATFIRSTQSYTSLAILCVLGLTVLQAGDLILAKNMLSPHDAGLYAGLASISRIVFFGGFIFVWLTLSEFKIEYHKNNFKILALVLGLLSTISVIFVAAMYLMGNVAVNILLHNGYHDRTVLTLASCYQSLVLLITFYVYSLLVRGKKILATALATCATSGALMAAKLFAGNTSESILKCLLLGTLAGLLVYGLLLLLKSTRGKK